MNRNYNSKEYRDFRIKVRKRDKSKCRFPHCTYKYKKVYVHHIKRYSDYPSKRFDVTNGICLCYRHHKQVTGKESEYEELLNRIANPISVEVKGLIYKLRNNNE